MGFGEHQPFGRVRWRHARLQTTEQTAGPGRWKIPPGMQPRLCLPGGPQPGLGDCRQPGSHRELARASQLSCPHPNSRILSAQAGRRDRELWEACGGLLGPWSFSAVAALGGGGCASSLPSPGQVSGPGTLVVGWGLQLSAWPGGQSSGRCRGVDVPVSAPARCQPPPGDLGQALPGSGLSVFLWDCWALLLEGHEATPTRPGKYKLCRPAGLGAGGQDTSQGPLCWKPGWGPLYHCLLLAAVSPGLSP